MSLLLLCPAALACVACWAARPLLRLVVFVRWMAVAQYRGSLRRRAAAVLGVLRLWGLPLSTHKVGLVLFDEVGYVEHFLLRAQRVTVSGVAAGAAPRWR